MARLTCLTTVVVLGAAVMFGCGVKKEVHQKVLDELSATQNQLRDAESERDAKAKRVKQLEDELSSTQADRDKSSASDKEKAERIDQLRKDMKATKDELIALRKQQEKTQERLKAFAELNQRFRKLVDTGKLQIAFRNGQMVLKLPSGVLFPSAKARLSRAGKAALTDILNVLQEFKDRRFLIAGHTDDLKIRSRKFKNNWYLSTARATSVLEFMIEAGFDPKNLGAAGYGEFDPVAPNDSAENRALNRRIEIILVPDLSELPNLATDPA